MKRIFTIIFTASLICMIPFSIAAGQEKKNEQKIKIVIADGSGTRVVIDTVITDGHMKDSIRLKGGKMIFIGEAGDDNFMKHADGSGHVYVYTSSDDKGQKKDFKTITVVSSDDGTWSEKDKDSFESSEDVTRSIIAKDGIVVTVEGKDEEKVKELVKEIHQKMGIKQEDSVKK